jgi:hypothetical protein
MTGKDLENVPSGLQDVIKSLQEKVKTREFIAQVTERAEEVHKEVGKPRAEQTWFPFTPMPTDLCRVSPFFPMAKREEKERPYLRHMLITKSAWGSIFYSGPKLSIFEEDVLVAILAILDTNNKNISESEDKEGRKTYTYQGPLLPILKLMGYKKFGGSNYKRVIDAIRLLAGAGVELETKGKWSIDTILIHGWYDEKSKFLKVTVNPFFYETYIAGTVTLLDVLKRSQIKGSIAKALYRFVMSHRDSKWQGHFLTLSASLNLDLNQPHIQLRRQIRIAISELKKIGILESGGFKRGQNEVVTLNRAPREKRTPSPKKLT